MKITSFFCQKVLENTSLHALSVAVLPDVVLNAERRTEAGFLPPIHTAYTSARCTHFYDFPHPNGVETHLQLQWPMEFQV